MTLVDFVCAKYSDGKVAADQELRKRIEEVGIRKVARSSKLDSKTIMLIHRGERVKPATLAQVIKVFDDAKHNSPNSGLTPPSETLSQRA